MIVSAPSRLRPLLGLNRLLACLYVLTVTVGTRAAGGSGQDSAAGKVVLDALPANLQAQASAGKRPAIRAQGSIGPEKEASGDEPIQGASDLGDRLLPRSHVEEYIDAVSTDGATRKRRVRERPEQPEGEPESAPEGDPRGDLEPQVQYAAVKPGGASDKTGASSQTIQIPKGPGKIEGMGESFSAQLSTGIATLSVPFRLLPARGAAQPSLGLSYSSANGWGIAGVGWDVGVPFIARQTDRGVPTYADQADFHANQDRFVFNGGQELVPICTVTQALDCAGKLPEEEMPPWSAGSQYFRPRVEGSFLRFFWSKNHLTWRVQDKSGITMEFGAPLDGGPQHEALKSLEYDPESPAGELNIYRWNLVRQYDTHGDANPTSAEALPAPFNVVRYAYIKDGPASYLSDIYDTTPAAAPLSTTLTGYAHHTRLEYEERPDQVTSYKSGWAVTRRWRLSRVDVTSKTFTYGSTRPLRQLVRRYHLAYTPGADVSLLESVQVEGRCGYNEELTEYAPSENASGVLRPTTCPRLPALLFGYTPYEAFDDRVHTMESSPAHSVEESLADFFDINADALPDVLVTMPGRYGPGHAVFFNSPSGVADSFGGATPIGVRGVLGATPNSIRLSNANLAPLDLDGDSTIDLLHMPAVRTYSVYTPRLFASSWMWEGRVVQTADGLNPRIDFGRDALVTRVLDVNFDGLVDVVRSTGTEMQTFLALGRYPGGNGRFGTAEYTGPGSARLSTEPIKSCLPWRGSAVSFGDPEIQLGDLNGDGIQDIVKLNRGDIRYWPGRGNGYWGTGSDAGCSKGGFRQNTDVAMGESPFFSDISGTSLRLDDVNGDGLDDLVQVRFDSVDIWVNDDGERWQPAYTIERTPASPSFNDRVRLVDINGSGTRDLVWAGAGKYQYIDLLAGTRPYLLTRVENGLGKSTEITYGTSTEEMLAAERAGRAFRTRIPMVTHVVKRVLDSDNWRVAGAGPAAHVTEYSYRDPMWDGRQREFRGFSYAEVRRIGDANSPTDRTATTFLLGQCEDAPGESGGCADPSGDNPREALKGLPVLTERFSEAGVYFSTDTTFYRLRPLYQGRDGRGVRYAVQFNQRSTLYDTYAAVPSSAQHALLPTVAIEGPNDYAYGDPSSPSWSFQYANTGTPAGPVSIPMRSSSGHAVLEKTSFVDRFGNQTAQVSSGCIDGTACPVAEVGMDADERIATVSVAGRPQGDETRWLFRTIMSHTRGSVRTQPRGQREITYDSKGNATQVRALIAGTLPLARAHKSAGRETAPAPPGQSSDGLVTIATNTYDSFGNLQTSIGANGQCSKLDFDLRQDSGGTATGFAQLPVAHTVYTSGNVSDPCSGAALTTSATYDRGLLAPVTGTDPSGQVTTVRYDEFGRLAFLKRPNPDLVTADWSLRVVYELATPTKPYSVVAVATQDAPDTASPGYLQTRTFVDGLGRARTVVSEADATTTGLDAGGTIRGEIPIFNAKGGLAAQHISYFTNLPLAAVPDTEAISVSRATVRYDAFGREIERTDFGGVVTLETRYHALTRELWDAADREDTNAGQPGFQRGKHYGTFAGVRTDGHGRVIAISERVNHATPENPVFETRETRTRYLPTGEPEVITRVIVGNGAITPVVRWMRYDSLGRMVLNVDPHTSVNYVAPGGVITNLKAWRYAYNNSGDLVGTSDARGCGVNYHYDGLSRLIAEDYSPCETHQVTYLPHYDAPNFATYAGIEVFYQYDAVPSSFSTRLPAAPGYVPNSPNLKGRLAAVFDRAGLTYMTYDTRGRVVRVDKAVANPDAKVVSTTTRYQLPWFTKNLAYDSADRVVEETTGASAPELLGSNSWIENTYSGRGTLSRVTSSYGELVTGIRRSADGLIEEIKHGDVALTSTVHTYDARRFLVESSVERAIPPLWSAPPSNYQPAPDPSTTQMILRFEHIDYDVVGNPIAITDLRDKTEWPAGAKPVSRQIQYDSLYRATQVDYTYDDGSDSWVSPNAAELSGSSDPRRTSDVPAHLVLPERVKRQTYTYDWLGSLTKSEDDRNAFWDRGMGPMRTYDTTGMPYRFRDAGDRAVATWPGTGWADATYDETGNITQIRVSRTGACTNNTTDCSHTYTYEYDELGRLYRARRNEGTPLKAELRFVYDHSDNRVIKSDVLPAGIVDDRHTLYVFNTLELRRAPHDATTLRYVANKDTEVPYLVTNGVRLGRAVLEGSADGEPRLDSTNARHLLLNLGDHLGSTSIVIDQATGELVERMTYQPYGGTESDYRPSRWKGFREDYRFTGKEEDQEVGLTYFGKRFLVSSLGRWLTPDPLGVHAPGHADLNLYAYVRGAILRAIDPIGLQDAPYERYGENAWGDQGFEAFNSGELPVQEQGADYVFESDRLEVEAPPGPSPQHAGVFLATPEGNPATRGSVLQTQLLNDTVVVAMEIVGTALDLGTANLTPLPFAEASILRRADQIGDTMLEGRRLQLASELREAAASYRETAKLPPNRNVAISVFESGGDIVDGPIAGVSGQASGSLGSVRSLPTAILEPQSHGGYVRAFDSEYKIMQNFADRYSIDTRGTLHIYTERPACTSCVSVGAQVEKVFPKVRVQFYHGPHVNF